MSEKIIQKYRISKNSVLTRDEIYNKFESTLKNDLHFEKCSISKKVMRANLNEDYLVTVEFDSLENKILYNNMIQAVFK